MLIGVGDVPLKLGALLDEGISRFFDDAASVVKRFSYLAYDSGGSAGDAFAYLFKKASCASGIDVVELIFLQFDDGDIFHGFGFSVFLSCC